MSCLVLKDYSNEERIFYSERAKGYLGGATAYYTVDTDFSLNYAMDADIIKDPKLYSELMDLFDMLRIQFYSFGALKRICEKSNRRIIERREGGMRPTYGFCYERTYKFYVRVNPVKYEDNFKIYAYRKDGCYEK